MPSSPVGQGVVSASDVHPVVERSGATKGGADTHHDRLEEHRLADDAIREFHRLVHCFVDCLFQGRLFHVGDFLDW
jgi:hypothetical protein